MIVRPMLAVAAKPEEMTKLRFPLVCSAKIDGVRCLKINGQAVTRKFKPLPNRRVAEFFQRYLPDGIDGELDLKGGGSFNKIQSAVMSEDGDPEFVFRAFDLVSTSLTEPYLDRVERLLEWWAGYEEMHEWVEPLEIRVVNNLEELSAYEAECLAKGHEGVMARCPKGPYKNGRSTFKEGWLLKIKQFADAEAKVVGFQERMHNANEATTNELGYTKRSSHQENKVGRGDLGALVLELPDGRQFNCGTGFDDAQRAEIWANRDTYLGQMVTYTFQPHGVKDLPRFPVFKHFRHELDMGGADERQSEDDE